MLYLFGIGIKNNITLARGLTNIYGIGLNESKIIIRSLGLSENIKVSNLEKAYLLSTLPSGSSYQYAEGDTCKRSFFLVGTLAC